MSHAEATEAVAMAMEADAPDEPLEVVCLSLEKALQLLVKVPDEAPAFRFVAPQSSLQHIQEYLEQ